MSDIIWGGCRVKGTQDSCTILITFCESYTLIKSIKQYKEILSIKVILGHLDLFYNIFYSQKKKRKKQILIKFFMLLEWKISIKETDSGEE